MKAKRITLVGLLILTLGIIAFIGCSKDSLTSPVNQSINKGIPAEEINWVSWKPIVKEQINGLAKKGRAGKRIKKRKGGTVGGDKTFDNTVKIPAGALPYNTFIEVKVLDVGKKEDGLGKVSTSDTQCGAEVEFKPSMQFSSDVLVTLSWAYLDVEDIPDFYVYYSEDGGETWFVVEDPDIDYENKTVSVWVDHFTRYAWGL